MRSLLALALLGLTLVACHKDKNSGTSGSSGSSGTSGSSGGTTGTTVDRCNIDLGPYAQLPGSGAQARVIATASDLIGGEAANGRLGDTLLINDKIRVIIQQPGRNIGADPYGGAIIDADLVHAGAGNDKFGKLAPFFNFGRTVNVSTLEVLADGKQGGPAIVAATGGDTLNDYLNFNSQVGTVLPGAKLHLDPDQPVGLKVTTYYVLAPGQSHVSVVTAFCNPTDKDALLTAGDLIDSGGEVALLNPQARTGGFGYGSSPDAMSWVGWMAADSSIAYGIAPWKLNDLSTPETHSNVLTVSGVTGYVIGNQSGLAGLLEWLSDPPQGKLRTGSLIAPAKGQVLIGREFAVGKDLGAVATEIERVRAAKSGAPLEDVAGTVSDPSGPVAGARVVAERPDPDHVNPTFRQAVFVTDVSGHFAGKLPRADYTFTAWKRGRLISDPVTAPADGSGTSPTAVALSLGETRTLTVSALDVTRSASGTPIPAKVTIRCVGACAVTPAKLVRFDDYPGDPRPDDVERIGFLPPSGTETFEVPPGAYEVIVTHGPEYSIHPLSAPDHGEAVDLTAQPSAAVQAKLAKVVDTTGWLSADFHVHCVNSPDSAVSVVDRVKTFLAEDVNVLLATDHDFITDFAPTNQQLGGTAMMATMVGEEVTTFDYGHYNPWPVRLDASDPVTHGALDWGNGTDLSLPIDDIFTQARTKLGATTVQINHANGNISTFGGLKLDANTLATHTPPEAVRLPASPRATANDTGLFPTQKFDAMEVMNGFTRGYAADNGKSPDAGAPTDGSAYTGLLNNWMTFAANGLVTTATAVSDTHHRWSSAAGYPRSYVQMADHNTVATFDRAAMSAAVNSHHVVGSLGLFVKAYAFKGGTVYRMDHLEEDCAAVGTACARVGDTLAIDSNGLDVVVDVQSPEWITFDEISLFDHRAARWMVNGVPHNAFAPEFETPGAVVHSVSPVKETVTTAGAVGGCGQASCSANRWHAQEVFHVTGSDVPAGDDFFFVVVRDADSSHNLMPMVYDGVYTDSSTGVPTIKPKAARTFAFTNMFFVDRDGGGYNHPPHTPATQPAPPSPKPVDPRLTPAQRLAQGLEALMRE